MYLGLQFSDSNIIRYSTILYLFFNYSIRIFFKNLIRYSRIYIFDVELNLNLCKKIIKSSTNKLLLLENNYYMQNIS